MLCIEIYLNFKQMKMHLNLRLNKMLPYRKYEHNDVEKQKMEHKAGGLSSICHFQGGCVTCIIEIRWELSVKHLIKDMVYGWQKNWLVQVVKATLSHGWVRGSCVAWGSERGWHVNASKSHFDICCWVCVFENICSLDFILLYFWLSKWKNVVLKREKNDKIKWRNCWERWSHGAFVSIVAPGIWRWF